MVDKVLRPVISILMSVVGGSMLFAGAFKIVVGAACCMTTVRMLVVKAVMWFVRMKRLVAGIAMLFEGIAMLVAGIVVLFVGMKKAVIKIALQFAQLNAWLGKTGKDSGERPCTIAILQAICSLGMYLFCNECLIKEGLTCLLSVQGNVGHSHKFQNWSTRFFNMGCRLQNSFSGSAASVTQLSVA
jgi:hypothetical protein